MTVFQHISENREVAGASSPADRRSRIGLDLFVFFVANLQTGFGPFVAVYLASHRWTQTDIGLALSVGTFASMLSQLPGGWAVDAMPQKRLAAFLPTIAMTFCALLFAFFPGRLPIMLAEVLHGFATCMLVPAIAAMSLALVPASRIGERFGRNARWGSIGNGLAAGAMGLIGTYISNRAVFILTALLTLPALFSLLMIRPARDHENGAQAAQKKTGVPLRVLFTDRRLLIFAACSALFQLSNAALLPLVGGAATERSGPDASLIIAACIVVPQIVVALFSPWVGRAADRIGRRTVLLIGFLALPIRALLFAGISHDWFIVPLQMLDGVSAAVFGVLMPLIVADITYGSGRFNLSVGMVGLAGGVGATISTTMAGAVSDRFGLSAAFLVLSLAGAAGAALVRFGMPETGKLVRNNAQTSAKPVA
ncbi:MFS transporter [Granulibacter bethesdensis]|uniref:Permease n=1 Tax=Granulibacter bethesdensis (strain ATCC BAA-1260 / CGDNIH1) TaxID=391165 RepID=Q0BQ59_GRABC|nr:MFS transporter [Granulibacter bethesdensis]ABI63043.1 Permease [Granulibacter bethesdensis CGDNIH1]APH52916.1 Permease [Granulibacter bethesdensis]APH65604.1 Permease [Granulibacter bethesdensis]